MICLNCGNRFKGNFCPHCGQSAKTRRLKLREMMTNAVAPFLGGDSRFVRSCRDLLVRPGIIVHYGTIYGVKLYSSDSKLALSKSEIEQCIINIR